MVYPIKANGIWFKCYDAMLNGRYMISIWVFEPYVSADQWAVVDDFGHLVGVGK